MAFEIFNLLFLYYLFMFAVVFSDLIFILSLFGLVRIRIPGPFAELWVLAFFLFVLEVLISLSYEKEDRPVSFLYITLAYTFYTKLWAYVVLKGFYDDSIARKDRTWAKTKRFDTGSPDVITDQSKPPPPAEAGRGG